MREHVEAQDTEYQIQYSAFFLAEYSQLRNEILKRIEIQHQLISLTLVVAGTFLSFGIQENVPAATLFVYPILVLFLAARYADNGIRIGEISEYIQKNIEAHLVGKFHGWEDYRRKMKKEFQRRRPLRKLEERSARGLFLVTQFLAIALALFAFIQSLFFQVGRSGVQLKVFSHLLSN